MLEEIFSPIVLSASSLPLMFGLVVYADQPFTIERVSTSISSVKSDGSSFDPSISIVAASGLVIGKTRSIR
ncbi:MAG: hypothetical protein M3Q36_00455 [bacterium]|nr:hypothetical protein [bacterium]